MMIAWQRCDDISAGNYDSDKRYTQVSARKCPCNNGVTSFPNSEGRYGGSDNDDVGT